MGLATRSIAATNRAAAEALTLAELEEQVFPPLLEVAQGHCVLLYRFGERSVAGLAGNLRKAMPLYTPEMFASDPVQQALLAMGLFSEMTISTRMHSLDKRALKRSLAWSDFYGPREMVNLLGMPMTPKLRYGEAGMTGVLIASDHKRDFNEGTLGRLSHVLPSITAAVRRIDRHQRALEEKQALQAVLGAAVAAPHLALDLRGRLLWADLRATSLLASAGFSQQLPAELLGAAAGLAALAHGERTDARFELTLPGPLSAWLSLARTASGELIIDVALEEPLPVASLAPLKDRCGLTNAETKTLALLSLGRSNRELAQRQSVSIETVRTHVRRILAKLSVRSREAAARLARSAAAKNPLA